jgi:hypothetical protein
VLEYRLPQDAARDLAEQVWSTAGRLYHEAIAHREASYSANERKLWDHYAGLLENVPFRLAGERLTELDRLELKAGWQDAGREAGQSEAERAHDPIQVKEPANENDRGEARDWAMNLVEAIKAMANDPARRAIEQERQAALEAFMAHADAVLGQARELSAETIKLDPWSAVYLPIPDRADAALLANAQATVKHLVTAMDHYIEEGREECDNLGRGGIFDPFMTFGRIDVGLGATRAEHREQAVERLAELDARLRPELAAIKEPVNETIRDATTQQFRGAAAEATGPRPVAPEPDAGAELAAAADVAVDHATHGGEGLLRGVGKWIAEVFEILADCFAPPPPPTKDQAERAAWAAEEQQEEREQEQAKAEAERHHWLIAEARRSAGREGAENEPDQAPRREPDRGPERER